MASAVSERLREEGVTDAGLAACLRARGWTVATAESCTGGRIAARLTAHGGSSAYFVGGVIAYANRVKEAMLGVDGGLLACEGAVSEAVAGQMASGARVRFGVDAAVAVTGIAGPAGGTDGKPVGLVYVAVATEMDVSVRRCQFDGDRAAIQRAATDTALEMLGQAAAAGEPAAGRVE